MAFIPTLDSSRLLRKKFINPQSLAELAVEANVWRTAQDNRYVTRAEYTAGGGGISPNIFDAKGDLLTASADNTPLRLAAGTNGQMLVPDSNQTAGVKWADRPALYTNLLTNPSVETNTTGISAAGSGTTISRVTTEQYVGTASIRAVCDGTVAIQGVNFGTGTVAANTYSAAAWVKAPAGTALALNIDSSVVITSVQVNFTATGSWQRVSTTGQAQTAGGGVLVLRVSTTSAQAVTFYVDAAMIVAGTEVPDYFDGDTAGCYWTGTAHASSSVRAALSATDGVGRQSLPTLTRNLVTNPSVEVSTAGWGVYGFGATISRSTSVTYSGVASLLIATTNTAGSGALFSGVRISPGVTYTVSAYVQVAAGNTFTFQVDVSNSAGTYLSSPIATSVTGSGTWQRVTGTFVAPTAAFTCAVVFYRSNQAAANIYVDALQVEVGTRATAYVDGDQKGCYWTGTPHASESVRMVRGDDGIAKLDLPELARNLVQNPSFESGNLSWWTAEPNATGAVVATDRMFGTQSAQVTHANTTPANQGFRNATALAMTTGVTYFVSAWVKRTAGSGGVSIFAFASTGAMSADNTSGSLTASTSWTRITCKFTCTTSGTYFIALQNTVSGASVSPSVTAGDTFLVDGVMIYEGASLGAGVSFFDGDSAGCYWTGTPRASESVRMVESATDYGLLSWLDAGRGIGVGSPEGVVAAPFGTRYVDTAGTVGAVEWVKWSGTGNTGWVASGSDTGDRLVASSIANLGDATLVARRVGSQVTVTLIQGTAGTATGTVSLTTLPVGFRPTRTGSIVAAPVVTQTGALVTGAALAITDAGVVTLTGATNATRHYAQVTYTTANAYPTTLPGTAA